MGILGVVVLLLWGEEEITFWGVVNSKDRSCCRDDGFFLKFFGISHVYLVVADRCK